MTTETIEVYPCARCGTGVLTRSDECGMLSDRNIRLVADWIFHTSCWDLLLMVNPKDE